MRNFFVYIMASKKNGTLYIGVTSNLARRAYEHREGLLPGFTRRYGVKTLVYAEVFDDVGYAMQREKNLKKWPRAWKIALIEASNPEWVDISNNLL
jgi:putative endonuclease